MNNGVELVVLVDEQDNEVGVMEKSKVHHENTPLHRAFSVFLFNEKGEVLVTQRAKSKTTWPGVWSNSFCGHPKPGESRGEAIERRAKEELGCKVKKVEKASDYRYRFERDGVVENEICPVYVAKIDSELKINPAEIEDYEWLGWEDFRKALNSEGDKWTEWCREEAELVATFVD